MTEKTKNRIVGLLLVMALLQGPVFYCFTEGLLKVILLAPFALFGLFSSVYLLVMLIIYRSTTTKYHVFGLIGTILIGLFTVNGSVMEYLDFSILKSERNKVVADVKARILNPDNPAHKESGVVTLNTWPPLSKGENQILINRSKDGTVSVEFYIDRGFIDHYSIFLYTNNPDEIRSLEKETTSDAFRRTTRKLADNWYRTGY